MSLKDQMSSMILVIGLMQLARRIDQTDPQNVLIIRLAYGGSQILLLLTVWFLRSLILRKNEKTMIEVEEAPAPFSTEPPKKQRMSIRDYDMGEVNKQLQQSLIGLVFMSVLHLWFGLTQPLILQSIMPWKAFLFMPLVKVHFWGQKAEGDLKRPWKAPSLFDQVAEEKPKDKDVDDGKAVEDVKKEKANGEGEAVKQSKKNTPLKQRK